jgi:hypothetical protein
MTRLAEAFLLRGIEPDLVGIHHDRCAPRPISSRATKNARPTGGTEVRERPRSGVTSKSGSNKRYLLRVPGS